MQQIWLWSIGLCFILSIGLNSVVVAQNIPDIEEGSFSVVRESARIPGPVVSTGPGIHAGLARRLPLRILLIPVGVRTDGAYVAGGTLGLSRQIGRLPAQLRVSYNHIFLEEDTGLNRLSGTAKLSVLPGRVLIPGSSATTTVTLIGEYKRTLDRSRRYDLMVSAEQGIIQKDCVVAGINIGYSNNSLDGAKSAGDITSALGLAVKLATKLTLSADYSFSNDVDGEDNYALTVLYSLPKIELPTTLIGGVGKHQTIVFSVLMVLSPP